MNWFTHFTRPLRRAAAPGGRNHVKRSPNRTACGVSLEPWLRNETLIMDAVTQRPAYPFCLRCRQVLTSPEPKVAWPVLGARSSEDSHPHCRVRKNALG